MKATIQFVLRTYQRWFSPLLLSSCRYVPSCSHYAMEAVERHGTFPGLLLAVSRILRCHPFSRGGFDPVPQSFAPRPQPCTLHPASSCNPKPVGQLKSGPSLAR